MKWIDRFCVISLTSNIAILSENNFVIKIALSVVCDVLFIMSSDQIYFSSTFRNSCESDVNNW